MFGPFAGFAPQDYRLGYPHCCGHWPRSRAIRILPVARAAISTLLVPTAEGDASDFLDLRIRF